MTEFELLLQKVEMGHVAHSSFDLKSNTMFSICTLQSETKEYFGNKIGMKCKYAPAPVKLGDRCVKATSDYGQKDYPSCAHILDFLRFSVTFSYCCEW